MTRQELAQLIVSKILEDLKDRRGFRHLLESIELEDEETYKEIQQSLINKVEDTLLIFG
jgi:hypothetical protein